MKQDLRIAVIGLGYVGLPVLIAINRKTKFTAMGFDINAEAAAMISRGESPIKDDLVAQELTEVGAVAATADLTKLANHDVFIVCVPTPVTETREPDYGPVIAASKSVGPHLTKGAIFVLESTVNPGTCDEIVIPLLEELSGLKAGKDFDVVHCPERINPGDTKWTIYNLPRVVGGSRREAAEKIQQIYNAYIDAPIKVVSTLKVAESAKILENSFRDVNIAFINEMAKSFDTMGIDLIETIEAASTKPMGFMAFWPGPGVGGHCIAVDPYYLIQRAAKFGFNHRFLKEARTINDGMAEYVVNKLMLLLNSTGKSLKQTKVGVLGMSYKANIGDLRESPALHVIELLKKLAGEVLVYDPYFPEDSDVDDLRGLLAKTDALVLTTNHREFIDGVTTATVKASGVRTILDTRNCLNATELKEVVTYGGIGR